VARVLRIADAASLDRDGPLLDLGFDSLMAVELRNVLTRRLALQRRLPATLVFDHPTIAAVATYLDGVLRAGDGDDTAGGAPATTSAALPAAAGLDEGAVAQLSDDEVEAMLLRRLEEIEP
jgi:Phosphopantetheine attachment site